MTDKKKLGILGEELAAEMLRGKGYYIISRNYTCPYGEVDIVASKENTAVFAEVKTRTSEIYGRPAEAVDYRKQKRIRNAARYFLASSRRPYEKVEFQVVKMGIMHIKGLEF